MVMLQTNITFRLHGRLRQTVKGGESMNGHIRRAAAAGLGLLAAAALLLAGKNVRRSGGAVVADIDLEDYGTITVSLDREAAPETVDNFISLARSGFYDGLTIFRAVDGFLIQGGAPDDEDSSAGAIHGEFSRNGVDNPLSHTRGAISMARDEDYDSASSQFFIVQEDSTYLDGSYAAFGYVVSGMDVVDQICRRTHPKDRSGFLPAEQQPVISSVTVRHR